jgi:hypothetical protein
MGGTLPPNNDKINSGTVLRFALAQARCKARPLLAPAMLLLGTFDKTQTIIERLPPTFLLIDDGTVIDALDLPARRRVVRLDFSKHHLNPLQDMDYKSARDFLAVLDAVFPEGANTLTRKNSNFVVLQSLLERGGRLDTLLHPSDDPAEKDAYQKIQTLLFSPVLKKFLCRPTNFSLDGIVLARINRQELGDFDAFVLGSLLMLKYKKQVVVTDFGFYGRPHHVSLIPRLIAGVRSLEELPPALRREVVLMPEKLGKQCTYEDALTLANYKGLIPGTVEHTDFVGQAL